MCRQTQPGGWSSFPLRENGFSDDHKLTDLLYLCYAHLKYGVSCDSVFNMIRSRYIEIRDHLELKTDLETGLTPCAGKWTRASARTSW